MTGLDVLLRRRAAAALLLSSALLAAPLGAAGDRWTTVRTPHFVVLSDAGPKAAHGVAFRFEQFRALFEQITDGGSILGERPITVVAARNEKTLRTILPGYWEDAKRAKPSGLFVAGLDRHHVVLRLDAGTEHADTMRELGLEVNPYHDIFHEYVHALLQGNVRLPLWLNEGIAEYYGASDIEKNLVFIGKPQAEVIWYLREQTPLPIETLLTVDHASPIYSNRTEAEHFYAQSWALVHYLRVGNRGARRRQLSAYRAQVEAGVESLAAARAVFGDLAQLQTDLFVYIRGLQFAHEVLPASIAVDDSGWVTEDATPAFVDVTRAWVHTELNRPDDAKAIVERLLAADAADARAWELASWMAFRRQDHAATLEAATKSIAAGIKGPLSYYLAGIMNGQGVVDDAQLATSQALFERGLAMDPTFAPLDTAMAETSLSRGRPPDEAIAFATRAITLAPREVQAYLVAGRAALKLGGTDLAVRLGQQALALSINDDEAGRARDFLAVARKEAAAAAK